MQFLKAARNVTHLYGRLHIKLNNDFKNDYNSLQQHGIHSFLSVMKCFIIIFLTNSERTHKEKNWKYTVMRVNFLCVW